MCRITCRSPTIVEKGQLLKLQLPAIYEFRAAACVRPGACYSSPRRTLAAVRAAERSGPVVPDLSAIR